MYSEFVMMCKCDMHRIRMPLSANMLQAHTTTEPESEIKVRKKVIRNFLEWYYRFCVVEFSLVALYLQKTNAKRM